MDSFRHRLVINLFSNLSYTTVSGYSGLIASRADGSDRAYWEQSANTFTFAGETGDRVVRTFDAYGVQTGYQYITGADDVEQYDNAGRLQTITSRSGVVQTLAYDASGYLSTVTDSFDHQLAFAWTADHHVQGITLLIAAS